MLAHLPSNALVLQHKHVVIITPLRQKFGVGAFLDQTAAVQDQDTVCFTGR
ncbi:hypothetical protein D3C80_1792740 [compost metagenome]